MESRIWKCRIRGLLGRSSAVDKKYCVARPYRKMASEHDSRQYERRQFRFVCCLLVLLYRQGWKWVQARVEPVYLVPERRNMCLSSLRDSLLLWSIYLVLKNGFHPWLPRAMFCKCYCCVCSIIHVLHNFVVVLYLFVLGRSRLREADVPSVRSGWLMADSTDSTVQEPIQIKM